MQVRFWGRALLQYSGLATATDCRGNFLQAHTFLVATAAPTLAQAAMTDSPTLNIVDDRHRQVPLLAGGPSKPDPSDVSC